jgi:hypothetical protein
MAFGQQSGPPATRRQLEDLLELVIAAGHVDLRDARGPLGLTQRQAAGKFTRDEADELIARLQAEAEAGPEADPVDADPAGSDPPPPAATRASPTQRATATPVPKAPAGGAVAAARARREAEALRSLRDVPDHLLAAELQRRGWAVMEP